MNFNYPLEKNIFYHFPTLLFSLIPFFLITGPFLSDLSVSLIGLLFIFYCIKRKDFSYFRNKYFCFFLLFWLYLVFNSLLNNFNINNFGKSLVYIRHGVFVIAVVALLNEDNKFIKYFFFCILFCFIILVLDGFYQYFSGENILGWKNNARTTSFFGEEKVLGSYISRLWPIFFGLSIFIFKSKDKLFFLFILVFVMSEVLIFLSGDRTAFFYINFSAIFIILFSKKLMRLRLFTLICSILILVIISFINPTAKERVFDKTTKDMNLFSQKAHEKVYIFSKTHHDIYISALKMFMDNKLTGIGPKNYRISCSNPRYYVNEKKVCYTHPHNTYIQILAETGIVGFLFLIFALFYFIKYLLKHIFFRFKSKYYFNDFEVCVLAGIALYLWPFVPTGSFFSNWLSILMFINIPFLIWSRNQKNK